MTAEKLGLFQISADVNHVVLERKTKELLIRGELSLKNKVEPEINTQVDFLDHMLDQVRFAGCFNLKLKLEATKKRLLHTICEDSGIMLGNLVLALFKQRKDEVGVNGYGASLRVMDEARARVCVSIEGRSNSFIELPPSLESADHAEDVLNRDMVAFFEGFAQGCRATLHLQIERANDPHHAWEAACRALGDCIREALRENSWRIGEIGGIKGTLD
jgi:imidazoleglycerol-phosphate dehydratase